MRKRHADYIGADGIDQLPADDRLELVGLIWDSLNGEQLPPIPAWHKQEVERRIAKADAQPGAGHCLGRSHQQGAGQVMRLPVKLTDEALLDLQQAHDWYNSRRAGLGITFVLRTKTKLLSLGNAPEAYALIWHNVRATTIKRFPYIVYYRIQSDHVEVLAILHGSRDASEWQRRALR